VGLLRMPERLQPTRERLALVGRNEAIETPVALILRQVGDTRTWVHCGGFVPKAPVPCQALGSLHAFAGGLAQKGVAMAGLRGLFAADPAPRPRSSRAIAQRARQNQVARHALTGARIEDDAGHATCRSRIVRFGYRCASIGAEREVVVELVVSHQHPGVTRAAEAR